ncbi:MAG: DUF1361 domain-containing protein [Bacteroidetes bacterium]|nr:DUF1361 domain-containing protein [Bacteroidota bacterium]
MIYTTIKQMLPNLFSTKKRYHLFLLLCLNTALCFALVGYRMVHIGFDTSQVNDLNDLFYTRSTTFLFLVWNLLLAWAPYLISLPLNRLPSKWLALPVLAIWLMFLPNAPYIVTDLLHVHYRPPVPQWYDVLMIFSFAWTGLLLGFLSLLDVHGFLEKNLGKRQAGLLMGGIIVLCSFGVYLGRYQRWNTWDLLLEPYQLFWDMVAVLMHPFLNLGSLGLAAVMAGVLGVGYLTLRTLVSER